MPASIQAELRIVNAAAAPGAGGGLGGSGGDPDIKQGFKDLSRFLRRPGTIFGGGGGGLGGLAGAIAGVTTELAALALGLAGFGLAIAGVKGAADGLAARFGADTAIDIPSKDLGGNFTLDPSNITPENIQGSPTLGGVLDITPTGDKGLEATPEVIFDTKSGTFRFKTGADVVDGIMSQFAIDFPGMAANPLGGTGGPSGSEFDLSPGAVQGGSARTQEAILKITDDLVVSNEEIQALQQLQKETLDVLVDLDEQKMMLQREGKDLSEEELDARGAVIDVLASIDILLSGEIDTKKNQIDLQKAENAELTKKLSLLRNIANASDKPRERKSKRDAINSGAQVSVAGQEGSFVGRTFNTPALGGEKFVGVRVAGS